MELVVHGTKGGFRTLYSTPNAPSIASDIRNNVSSEDALGKSVYSLAFIENGCVFSKYTIIRDTLRNYAIGTIAFSLYLPANKELSGKGADVKSLLDRLSRHYAEKFIIDNNINCGEASIIQEDWSFINSILSEYREQNKTQTDEEVQPGTNDAAFVYYKDSSELQDYFDKPYQEEYNGFKQILYIESNLQGNPSNPLNTLRNSGKELKNIDLKNEYYYLSNFSRDKGVTITADGKPRSDTKYNNSIRAKWNVEIVYLQNRMCFEPTKASGTLSNRDSDIFKYLEIRGNSIIIKYDAFNNPREREKFVTFEIKDSNGVPVNDAEIQFGSQPWQKVEGYQYKHLIKGLDLKGHWPVSARKVSEKFYSAPISVSSESPDIVKLTMQKREIVKIIATNNDDDGNAVLDYKFWINDGKGIRENVTEWPFTGDDIGRTWMIEITKKIGLDNYSSGIKEYCPAKDDNPFHVTLKKVEPNKPKKKYSIDVTTNGKGRKAHDCPRYSYSKEGDEIKKYHIIPPKGYEFKGFEFHEAEKGDEYPDGTIVATYEKIGYNQDETVCGKKERAFPFFDLLKKQKKWLILGGGAAICLFIAVFFLCFPSGGTKTSTSPISSKQIINYVQGDSLFAEKLKEYKKDWEAQKPKAVNPLWSILSFSRKGDKHDDDQKEWKDILNSIDSAIEKRKFIDRCDFAKIMEYDFSHQGKFIDVINRISADDYRDVKNKLGDVSGLTLTEIANSINDILIKKEEEKENALVVTASSVFPLKKGSSNIETVMKLQKALKILYSPRLRVDGDFGDGTSNCLTSSGHPVEVNEELFNKLLEEAQNKENETPAETKPVAEQLSGATNITNEILEYIRGDELDKAKLEGFKNKSGVTAPLKASIQLCIDFWEVGVKAKYATYWAFREKVKKDTNLKDDSKLMKFLNKMNDPNVKESYLIQDKGIGLKEIN